MPATDSRCDSDEEDGDGQERPLPVGVAAPPDCNSWFRNGVCDGEDDPGDDE